jgi:serine/threonine-protein kinase RsbW
MGEEHRIVIPGIQERIPDVCDFVVVAARRANLNERAVYHCQMAVDEACTNVIEHGYGGNNTDGHIEIICRDTAATFAITIIDDSPPFNPLLREDPDPDEPLADREPGGWGIYFIKKMMDEVDYLYEGERNQLTIRKLKSPVTLVQPTGDSAVKGVAVRELQNGIWEVTPTERLESNTAPELQSILDMQLAAGNRHLIVNMHRTTFISTSGLKVLVSTWRTAQKADGDIVLAEMQPQVREVFDTVGFDQIFAIYPTVDKALVDMLNQTA